ncbi:hypothetical protein JW877_10070 [bacterium]|nr:hypothetical protein [bacterium]
MWKPKSKILALLLLFFYLTSGLFAKENDPIFQALNDEMIRSLNELKMQNLEKPYFISCGIQERQSVEIEASFGAILNSDSDHYRELAIDLRIGDYKFDNSNYGMDFMNIMVGGGGPFDMDYSSTKKVTLDNDYDILRHQIWYEMDGAYKQALEDYAGKKAALSGAPQEEDAPGDLSQEQPQEYYEPPLEWTIDKMVWENNLKEVSAVFNNYPFIKESYVHFNAVNNRNYILNTEGTRVVFNDLSFTVSISAMMQDEDGFQRGDNYSVYGFEQGDLPSLAELKAEAEKLARGLQRLSDADTIKYYVGPVLFEKDASISLFSNLLAKKLIAFDLPVVEASQSMFMKPLMEQMGMGDNIGKKIAAGFISIYDDPTIVEYKGIKLAGHYKYDLEGVIAQRVVLCENGILKQVLNHRKPTKKQPTSNGHALLGSPGGNVKPSISNLFIKAEETISSEGLIEQFKQKCLENGLEYGLIIRNFYTPSSEKELMKSVFSSIMSIGGGGKLNIPMDPLYIYKIDLETGNETLLKNLQIDNLDDNSLKDIILASEEEYLLNRGSTTLGSSIGVAIVAPEMIVIDDLELSWKQPSSEEKPYLPNPSFEK